MLARLILSIMMIVICAVVIGYIIFQINELLQLSSDADGYTFAIIFGVLLILSLTMLVISGLWGTATKNYKMVSGFASNWMCILILVIIQGVLIYTAYQNCDNENVQRFVNCSDRDAESKLYTQLISIGVFAIIAMVVAGLLASTLKKSSKNYDY
eukprot:TRINITY_DN2936_c0_g1_i1.p1 TRINITY_DN2936_c0_g1~~TRINITY_DN2936_c0_g1_i1.p1  ORF type:complete len:155 (+),score=16.79 TRINITY_DN2936_c0_g1_i1:67-531(+)